MSDSKNAAAKMPKKSRYRNFEGKAGTVLLHYGGKAGTWLPPKAGTGLPLWEKAGAQPESETEKAAANSKNTNQVVGVDGRDL